MITAQMVKELRNKTGAGMMDCKKALSETNGDIDEAVKVLREKGLAAAAKKSGRIAAEGLIETYISEDKKVGSIVEINCETDFVAVNDEFTKLSKNIAKQVAVSNVLTVEELMKEKYIENENMTVKEVLVELISKLGENINIRRFERFTPENGAIQSYIHGPGKIGVLVEVTCDVINDTVLEIAKEVAMQVAATNPLFLSKDQIDEKVVNKEREIYKVQALNEGKPEKIVDKIVEGKIQKYLKEVCLIEQIWVKDSDYTISKYLAEKSKEIGSTVTVTRFARFERGEGIEKEEEDFACEVEKQMKQ